MNDADMISVYDVKNVFLEDVLLHCSSDLWSKGEVAKSRYDNAQNNKVLEPIRDADTNTLDYFLQSLLKKEVDPIIEKYAEKMNISISKGEGCYLVRYGVGQFFKAHIDNTKEFSRKISAVLYLNDNYEGGTLTFTKINKKFKPKSNTLFVFPSSEKFEHSADPVTSGIKYCIVGFWS